MAATSSANICRLVVLAIVEHVSDSAGCIGMGLEIFSYSGDFERVRRVGAGFFAAESRTREEFVGVGDLVWVEGATDELHGVEVGLGVHVAHGLLFLLAHAMFTGDGPSVIDAEVKNANGEIDG